MIDKTKISQESYETTLSKGFEFGDDKLIDNLSEAIGELFEGQKHLRDVEQPWLTKCHNSERFKLKLEAKDITEFIHSYKCLGETSVEFEITGCYLRTISIAKSVDAKMYLSSEWSQSVARDIGGCKSYNELILMLSWFISSIATFDGGSVTLRQSLFAPILDGIEKWCSSNDIDLEWFVAVKLRYNKTRPYLHGRKR